MEVTLQRNLISSELSILQGVVEYRGTIPILSSILMESSPDGVRLTATDLDMTILTECAAVVHSEGKLILESKIFQNLVSHLPSEEFSLRLDGDSLEMSAGRFLSRMSVVNPAEFPTIPTIEAKGHYALSLDLLKLMLKRVDFAITKEDPKFQLNGALVKLLPGEIEIAATDGHRLAVVRAPGPNEEIPFEQQLFPRKLLTEFARFSDESVTIGLDENHLGFWMGDRSLISRIVDLKFPQYEKVIVRDHPFRARVNRLELLSSLRRVSLMANEKARGVRFAFDPSGDLTLQSFGYERGEAHETLGTLYQGEPIEVSLNASFIIDFLQVVDVEMVEFQMKSPKNQTILVPIDDDARLEEYVYVLMPMRV